MSENLEKLTEKFGYAGAWLCSIMELVADILEKSVTKTSKFKSTSVNKLLDVEYDVGALLVVDTNDLDTRLLA